MSLFKIAWRSIQQRALSSWLTGLSMALGVALVVSVLVILNTIDRTFQRNAAGFHLIVGAKGSSMQLVLNTIYHLNKPIENIPYTYYLEFKKQGEDGATRDGRYGQAVKLAIPFCLGDNYEGYRVVGTTRQLFDAGYGDDQLPYRFAAGRSFKTQDFFHAVIGSEVAKRTGLKVGESFNPTHGLTDSGDVHDAFKIVGVLEPTRTPNDRALFVNIEGFFLLSGHALDPAFRDSSNRPRPPGDRELIENPAVTRPAIQRVAHLQDAGGDDDDENDGDDHGKHKDGEHVAHEKRQPLPIDQREVTAILVRTTDDLAMMSVMKHINKNESAQAVNPVRVIYDLFEGILGNVKKLLLFMACMIVVVASIGVMVAIYNTMSDRRRDIAVMRALGADRRTVMLIILIESLILSLGGGVAGVAMGHLGIGLLSPLISAYTNVEIGFLRFMPVELLLVPALAILATVAGIVPAMSAYRTDVGKSLAITP